MAELIWYWRCCKSYGRIDKEDVQLSIQIRPAYIVAGGYKKQERKLTTAIRQAVIKRYDGKSCICGKIGTEIDHINDLSRSVYQRV